MFPYERLSTKMLAEMKENRVQLKNAILLWDEAHQALDSRSGMKSKNKAITYGILMSRKLSLKIILTSQHLHQLDKRLRDSCDVLVFCKNLSNKTSVVNIKDRDRPIYIQQSYLLQWADDVKPKMKILHANPIFPLYDTEEIIDESEEG